MNADLIYSAGFFDGEGCISIAKNGSLSIGIVNTGLPALKKVQGCLGGVIQSRVQKVNKAQFVWRLYGEAALLALLKLIPYLIDKRDQALIAQEWMSLRDTFATSQIPGRRGRVADSRRADALEYSRNILSKLKRVDYVI